MGLIDHFPVDSHRISERGIKGLLNIFSQNCHSRVSLFLFHQVDIIHSPHSKLLPKTLHEYKKTKGKVPELVCIRMSRGGERYLFAKRHRQR